MDEYKALRMFVKTGKYIAIVCGITIAICFVLAYFMQWIGLPVLAVGVIISIFIAFLMTVLADMTRLVSEMLLPR